MIAWIQSPGRLPYVAAVLRDRDAAERYLAELPDSLRERSMVAARDEVSLPCYLAEDRSGFRALSEPEAQDYVTELARGMPDEEGVYAILYRLDGEFLPIVAGRDEMGRLPHIHLEDHHLAFAARAGVAALWGDRSDAHTPSV